jgi:beta-lactamase class A
MGFLNTRLRRIMMDRPAARRNEENVSTPSEMARLVEVIYRGKAVDANASAQMIDIMKLVKGDFRKAVPATVVTASKTGDLNGVRCETGVILLPGRPFVLSVMSTYLIAENGPIAEVTGMVYRHFEKLAQSNRYGHRTE